MPNAPAAPDNTLPSLAEIDSAATLVYSTMPPTPQYRWPLLCERLGMELWLEHENHTPLGAFKIRGGLVYFADLAQRGGVERVVSATRGNHGQSLAFAARRHGIEPIVVVPVGNSAEKNAAMRALGARLIEHGHDFQEAREFAETFAETEGASMVPSCDAPDLRMHAQLRRGRRRRSACRSREGAREDPRTKDRGGIVRRQCRYRAFRRRARRLERETQHGMNRA